MAKYSGGGPRREEDGGIIRGSSWSQGAMADRTRARAGGRRWRPPTLGLEGEGCVACYFVCCGVHGYLEVSGGGQFDRLTGSALPIWGVLTVETS